MCVYIQRHGALTARRLRRAAHGRGQTPRAHRPPCPRARGSPVELGDDTKPDRPASQSASPERARQPALTNEGRAARPRRDPLDGSRLPGGAPGPPRPRRQLRARIPGLGEGEESRGALGRGGSGQRRVPRLSRGVGSRCHECGCGRGRDPRRGVEARGVEPQTKDEGLSRSQRSRSAPGVRARPPLHTCGRSRGCPRVGAPAATHPPRPAPLSARRGSLSRLFAWAGESVLRDYSAPASFLLGGPERPQRLGTPF